ncbi:MAG: DUF4145 domain-containing protein [Thermodesulfobacteriota bacterium]
MKCPHCLDSFNENQVKNSHPLGPDQIGGWYVYWYHCPTCKQYTICLWCYDKGGTLAKEIMVWPKGMARTPLSKHVPVKYAEDYEEACLVLSDSPKASAALSRRCLQLLLRDEFKVTPSNLYSEIQEVIDSRTLPPFISNAIDAVRSIGNFAAHPLKSKSTGEIVPVESGESEWLLDVLESLFDFCFISPEKLRQKKADLNQKLVDAGKPPMK